MSILAGARDHQFLTYIVRHLNRVSRYPYHRRSLVIDAKPHPDLVSLRRSASQLVCEGVMDDILEVTDGVRDHRGIPLNGWTTGIEATPGIAYHVHYDCDILLYQKSGHCWVKEAIAAMEKNPNVFFVAPLPGPPSNNQQLLGQQHRFTQDKNLDLYLFKTFSSRRFLTDRRRFAQLPIKPRSISRKRQIASLFTGKSHLHTWETAVSMTLSESPYFRANLASPLAWSLHAPDHGRVFIDCLPDIISRVETGDFPEQQAGRYDLDLVIWEEQAEKEVGGAVGKKSQI